MAEFHSSFLDNPSKICNLDVIPLRSKVKGPAPCDMEVEKDIIDEALTFFKPLIFFRQYEIKSGADRVLVYLVLYIIECLKKLHRCSNKLAAVKELNQMASSKFPLPGEQGFPVGLGSMYQKPKTPTEADQMRAYLTQLRTELGNRLIEKVYESDQAPASKWWLCFSKKRFLDQSLSLPGAF